MHAGWKTTLMGLVLLAASACGEPRPLAATSSAGSGCTGCHGDSTKTASAASPLYAAPPRGTNGETATSEPAVGAHQAHLLGKSWSRGIACAECHPVPNSVGHQNGKRDMAFGPLATTGGASPSWNGTGCAASYCHGNFKNGNSANAPVWSGAGQAACGSCHGTPPGGTHPANSACGTCHTGYTATTVNLDLHVNGVVDIAGGQSCTSCHGQAGRAATPVNPQLAAAPPVGTRGETLTSQRAVGAHLAHLQNGALRAGVACGECHVVPASTTHSNGSVEMSWGSLARTGGVTPIWNGATCSASYCHGNFKNGNTTYAPNWTAPAANMCGTCHGLPPGGTHPASSDCGSCHTGYTSSTVNLAVHLDGKVDVANLGCTSCHGDSTKTATQASPLFAAPPVGTTGETAATTRAVGAHQKHLVAGPLTSGVACGECHAVPASVAHSNGAVEITWGTLARSGGVSPSWNGTSCSASYCHGNFKNGNTTYAPNWTAPAASACGTCHGLPPGGTHPAGSACGSCHTGYTISTVNLAVHADGKVDVANLTCTSCHGDSTKTATQASPLYAAPPVGTKGETAITTRAVGAHQRHLVASTLTSGVACTECHAVPASTTHSTGTVEMSWGTLARTGNVTPSWNGTSCSASYCHGNFTGGNKSYAANWTAPAANSCGTCHPAAPSTGQHSRSNHVAAGCGACHSGYTATAINVSIHLNGTKNVGGAGTKVGTWASPSCTPNDANACHGTETW